jgi:hypothetical protein
MREIQHGNYVTIDWERFGHNGSARRAVPLETVAFLIFQLLSQKIDFFFIPPLSFTVLTNDFKYGRLYLFHLLLPIQCIQSQTHSMPFRVLCKACLQNLLRNIPLRRRCIRYKVHVLQHHLHTFSHSSTRTHQDLPRRTLRTTPGRHSIRSRTCHASSRTNRRRT